MPELAYIPDEVFEKLINEIVEIMKGR